MKTRIALFAAALLSMGFIAVTAAQQADPSVPDRLKVAIDTQQTAAPVSKYEFGMFIEHIGPSSIAVFGLRCLMTVNSSSRSRPKSPRLRPGHRVGRVATTSFTNGALLVPMKL